ncbi:MAG: 3-deoxy-manno-octulosonate cytidylyltransferase [Sphingobacteriales bacterium]|nr:MAG: 3-deoxy-manno-octulosonate cytidylyltransferase [Sphingobacteriales bacterium]
MQIVGIIPARYASTRFEGKPLCLINGKTMIQRVYENSKKSVQLSSVWVATDDLRIYNQVLQFGGQVVMTSYLHQSGTDRCAEAFNLLKLQADVVINIQGDEPFIHPNQIDELALLFSNPQIQIGTLVKIITDNSDLLNPNLPKVILDKHKKALYFSRQMIPYVRDIANSINLPRVHTFYSHVGMYGFRSSILNELVQLPTSSLENAEKLEQLRWLENGYSIHTQVTDYDNIAIDTPEDLEKALRYLKD